MTKKKHGLGINAILGNTESTKKDIINENISTKQNYVRSTYYVTEDIKESITAIAYWERKKVLEIVKEAFSDYLSKKNSHEIQEALNLYRKSLS